MTRAALEQLVQQSVSRIVSVAAPKQVYLFGSAARGDQHANSDIDLLVVMANGTHRRHTAQRIYRNMIGLGYATDVVVVTEEDVEKYRDAEGYVIRPALTEGRLVYAA